MPVTSDTGAAPTPDMPSTYEEILESLARKHLHSDWEEEPAITMGTSNHKKTLAIQGFLSAGALDPVEYPSTPVDVHQFNKCQPGNTLAKVPSIVYKFGDGYSFQIDTLSMHQARHLDDKKAIPEKPPVPADPTLTVGVDMKPYNAGNGNTTMRRQCLPGRHHSEDSVQPYRGQHRHNQSLTRILPETDHQDTDPKLCAQPIGPDSVFRQHHARSVPSQFAEGVPNNGRCSDDVCHKGIQEERAHEDPTHHHGRVMVPPTKRLKEAYTNDDATLPTTKAKANAVTNAIIAKLAALENRHDVDWQYEGGHGISSGAATGATGLLFPGATILFPGAAPIVYTRTAKLHAHRPND
eukprot:jgi/Psemu1/23149/gm1.23149_g